MVHISQNNTASKNFFYLLKSFSDNILASKDKLEKLSRNSEKEFLNIGSKLQNFLITSKKLGEIASQTASSVSDELLNNGISELNALLTEFGEIINHSSKEIKSDKDDLISISKRIAAIVDELDGFRSIIKKLRMLGVATKIESARLGTDDNGFNALAENVDNLSSLIGSKLDSINRKSSDLFNQISVTTADLAKLEIEHQVQSGIILNNTKHSLNAFENKRNSCFRKAERISDKTQSVVTNIRDIVTSIQFHDITRQQIEHVSEALQEAAEITNQINEEAAFSRKAGVIHDICELQIEQLRNSVTEFDNAVVSIISHLQGVADNVTGIFSEVKELLKDKSVKDGSTVKEISSELYSVSTGLLKNKEIEKELSVSIKSVISILDELSQYLLEIEDIGTEIEIIALNARVKAARTGDKGGALGVLAEAILNLSLDAKQHTTSTAVVLNNILEASQKLKSNLEVNNSESSHGNISVINSKINNLLMTLIHLENETESSLSKMNTEVNSLNQEINNTISDISINKTMNSTVSEVILLLTETVYELKLKGNLSNNRGQHISELQKKYTMHSERKIHKSYTNDWSLSDEGENKSKSTSQDDLGDNVELF